MRNGPGWSTWRAATVPWVSYEDIPTIDITPTTNGPITRSRAKLTSEHVNANLSLSFNHDDTTMHSSCLLLTELRFQVQGIQQSPRLRRNQVEVNFTVENMLQ